MKTGVTNMNRHRKFSGVGMSVDIKNLQRSRRKIDKIIIHCSANVHNTTTGAKYIDLLHLKRWGRNSGCGYHYIVTQVGYEKGRLVDFIGSHAHSNNENSIGVVYMGGLNDHGIAEDNLLTSIQLNLLVELVKQLAVLYPGAEILGHRELPNVNKACPCLDMDSFRSDVSSPVAKITGNVEIPHSDKECTFIDMDSLQPYPDGRLF